MKRELLKFKNFWLKNYVEIIFFTCYLILLILIRIIIPNEWVLWKLGYESDNEFYYMMAENISCIFDRIIISPFCYRVFQPFIIYILPFDIKLSFTVIGFISYYLLGIVLYYTLRIHFDKIYSLLGMLLFIIFIECSINFLYVEFSAVYNVDGLTYLFFICCFYAILKRKNILYAIFLVLGVLTKESILFTIPVFFLYNYYVDNNKLKLKKGLKSLLRNFKFILPAIISVLIVRLVVVPLPIPEHYVWYMGYNETDYLSLDYFKMMINREISFFFIEDGFYWYIFKVWGILPIFLLLNKTEDIWKWIRIYGIFIFCAYLQLIIGKTDFRARFLYIAYYPVIYLSVLGIKRINELLGTYIQNSNNQIFTIKIKRKKDYLINYWFFFIIIVYMILYSYFYIIGVLIIIASLLAFQIARVFMDFNNKNIGFFQYKI